MSERIDKVLVAKGMLNTRSQARMLIAQGDIYCNGVQVKKAGHLVEENDHLEIKERTLYVGRGAYKLEGALELFKYNPTGVIAADIGASTGGFTQVLLMNGAEKVYAVDVGHGQLSPILLEDSRVVNMEGVNIKNPLELPELVDLCVVDLSFISLKLVFKNIYDLLKPGGEIIALVKPQFEAGKERIGKNGLVKESLGEEIFKEILEWMKENNYVVTNQCLAPIQGKTGNQEYLIRVSKP